MAIVLKDCVDQEGVSNALFNYSSNVAAGLVRIVLIMEFNKKKKRFLFRHFYSHIVGVWGEGPMIDDGKLVLVFDN